MLLLFICKQLFRIETSFTSNRVIYPWYTQFFNYFIGIVSCESVATGKIRVPRGRNVQIEQYTLRTGNGHQDCKANG